MLNIYENNLKVCNLRYLNELSNGNQEFIKEIIQIFLIEMPKEIQSIEKSIHEKDYEAIRQATHKLKSTIPFVGLDLTIQEEVYKMEDLAEKRTDLDEIRILFQEVKNICGMATAELNA